jgi:hypothetical protein
MIVLLTVLAWALVTCGLFAAFVVALRLLYWLIDELPSVLIMLFFLGVAWAVHFLGLFS